MEKTLPKWRNFAVWCATGILVYGAILLAAFLLRPDGLPGSLPKSAEDMAIIAPALLLASVLVGLTKRESRLTPLRFVRFAIVSVTAVAIFLLVKWGLGAATLRAVGFSAGAAVAIGAAYVAMGLMLLALRAGARFLDAERADDMRREGREFALAAGVSMAWGAALVVFALAAPGGAIPPSTALAVALALIAISIVLGFAQWHRLDELKRSLSQEAGNWSLYLILILGGGWAALAHLGFVAEPRPLDWLSLFSVLMLIASVIASGRRGLLETR